MAKIEDLRKICSAREICEQEITFLRIADDKIKASIAKLQTLINNDTLRIDSLENQIKSKLETGEFKQLSAIVMQLPTDSEFKEQSKKIGEAVEHFSDLTHTIRQEF